jgi:hypothetical protein
MEPRDILVHLMDEPVIVESIVEGIQEQWDYDLGLLIWGQ